eukprot:3333276-Ditylum_brightwellii.AAC.1
MVLMVQTTTLQISPKQLIVVGWREVNNDVDNGNYDSVDNGVDDGVDDDNDVDNGDDNIDDGFDKHLAHLTHVENNGNLGVCDIHFTYVVKNTPTSLISDVTGH